MLDQGQTYEPVMIDAGTHHLAGHLSRPLGVVTAVCILQGATGIPHGYYKAFANWLAEKKGIACLTFDYRDFGASLTGPMAQSKVLMSDWGLVDQQVARDWLADAFPDVPLWVIGHSLGGLMLPFQQRLDQIDRVICVASGPVNIKDHPWHYKPKAYVFWHAHGPVLAQMFGYLPGRFSGINEDLPKNVYFQWRRWCTSRDFNASDIGKRLPQPDVMGIKAPTKFVAIQDDPMVPPQAVWRHMQSFKDAPITQLLIKPKGYGLGKIGHLSVFAKRNSVIWDDLIAAA
ncbi:alpha/beta hydrolase family protein [Parasulfitobacter algicola]|uniref:Alpha/beta fold hydrolase n=1 Tax=Parasulfitobacter algicola TaxID=2614809 RepID=A0ABX2ISZ4_9RHOB|nr:alpha/beta fold hydrolase [Sulfitobacter algicola]NSX53406.1 alpha/beta fold hydrolase [Sulfitobacter algicola]